jgi:hypothetical protein
LPHILLPSSFINLLRVLRASVVPFLCVGRCGPSHGNGIYFACHCLCVFRVSAVHVREKVLYDKLRRRVAHRAARQIDIPRADEGNEAARRLDRFQVYRLLLVPPEQVREDPKSHPEGDVLYHSLQVFELARQQRPYDEEFLLAALLHDVGKGMDRREHVAAVCGE